MYVNLKGLEWLNVMGKKIRFVVIIVECRWNFM